MGDSVKLEKDIKEKIIFKTKDNDFKFKDIISSIKEVGIKKGDTLMVHADLSTFGKLGQVTDKNSFANAFIEAFREVIGEEGTLIVPTFTYSFCNNEVYDPGNTPSKVGLFTEELRKRKDAFRSIHPIFSIAAIGKKAKELTANISKNSFGKGSIYDKLTKIENAKYVIFGVNYFACTLVHYIEEEAKVPYRYAKIFKGTIKSKDKIYTDEYEFFVRYLDKNVNVTFDKIEKHLLGKGLLKKNKFGNGWISMAKCNDIYREGKKMLEKDPLFFLANKPDL